MTDITTTAEIYAQWSLEQLAEEANEAAGNAERQQKAAEQNKKQAGEMLAAAKKQVKHGEWGQWLKDNWKYSQQWATECMRAAGHATQTEFQIESDFQNGTTEAGQDREDETGQNESDFQSEAVPEIAPLTVSTTESPVAQPAPRTKKEPEQGVKQVLTECMRSLKWLAVSIDDEKRRRKFGAELRRIADKADPPRETSKFRPPTVADVEAFAAEHGLNVDAQKFVDFYESKGWKVGRSPMKNWQAALRRAAKEGWCAPEAEGGAF